jgi:hypothetical protein
MENEIEKLTEKPTAISYFSNSKAFEHVQRIAMMFSKSDLVPVRFQNNPGNCIIAIEMAERMGASYLMVMQNLDVIQGKPSFSSTFLIACINACGKFSPLRYEEDDKDGGRCRAWALDKLNNEKIFGIWVSMEMAKLEGWVDRKGSKWKTIPALMLRYRSASFFQRQFAPEISMGFHTTEELIDITPIQAASVVTADKELERIKLLINDATTIEELELYKNSAPDSLMVEFMERKDFITELNKTK